MNNKISTIIRDVWFGRELLWRVFWIYKFCYGGILGLFFQLFAMNKMNIEASVILAIYTVFQFWVLIGMYFCRNNVKSLHFLSKLIPVFVFLNFILLFLGIIQFFFFFEIYSESLQK